MPLITPQQAIDHELKKDGVIPDVLDEFKPKGVLDISYGPGKEVRYGNELKPSETQKTPKISVAVTEFGKGSKYTLVMTDPDAPTRENPRWGEYAHYIVSDIELDVSKPGVPQELSLSKAVELVPYMGPGPPPKTGLHRYVFALFEGSTKKVPTDRPNWGYGTPSTGLRKWNEDQKLVPVAANFFVARNESG